MAEDNTARQRYISRATPSLDLGSRGGENDPLTELARLIGQTNPFGEQQQRTPRPSGRDHEWPGSPSMAPAQSYAQPLPLAARYDDGYQDDGAYDTQPQSYSPPPPASAYTEHQDAQYDPHTQYGQGEPAAPYYGDNGQLSADDPYAQQQYDYQEPPKRRSGLITVVAVAALALVGTGGAYAYRTFFSVSAPGVPPIIKADAGPNKVVPTTQQSADAGANKQIYDRVGAGGQAEKIISREEQPVDVKPANTRPAYVPANGGSGGAASAVTGQATSWPNPPGATVVAPAPGNQSEPRKVRTVTIRPDQPGSTPQPPAQAPARNAATDLAPPSAPAARSQLAAPARSSNAPLSLTPQGGERTASADPRAVTARAAPVQTTGSNGSGYVVQLSAQKTEEEASAAFRSAQSRHPNLLGSRQLILRRKEIAGKGTFYGAQVGPFASRDEAAQLCESLKSAGGACMVQKN
jgi:hypothetical protein